MAQLPHRPTSPTLSRPESASPAPGPTHRGEGRDGTRSSRPLRGRPLAARRPSRLRLEAWQVRPATTRLAVARPDPPDRPSSAQAAARGERHGALPTGYLEIGSFSWLLPATGRVGDGQGL